MIKLIIIADDLTGAMEAGSRLGNKDIPSRIIPDYRMEFPPGNLDRKMEVLIINTESRHLSPKEASTRIKSIVNQGVKAGIFHYYKKTDSTLRGNIGAELEALMKSCHRDSLVYMPAHPAMKRFTIKGYQYLGSTLLHRTKYRNDLLDPVRDSYIPVVLRKQVGPEIKIKSLNNKTRYLPDSREKNIYVLDSRNLKDFDRISKMIGGVPTIPLLAGTAAFADWLPQIFALKSVKVSRLIPAGPSLVINGSLNSISIGQVKYAYESGLNVDSLNDYVMRRKSVNYNSLPNLATYISGEKKPANHLILTTSSLDNSPGIYKLQESKSTKQDLVQAAGRVGSLIKKILHYSKFKTLVIFGGDTLSGIIKKLNCESISPAGELMEGISLSLIRTGNNSKVLISKPGGYGNKFTLVEILKRIKS